MEIRRPNLTDKETILEMIGEFLEQGSELAGLWHLQDSQSCYEDWLDACQFQEMGLVGQGVPAIQYVAFDKTGQALGFLSIRLRLNDSLLQRGGHIGYSVRPSQRGKGYAKKMLQCALGVAMTKNIRSVLVTCHESNVASRAVILANGGILEDNREGTERYWIEL
ncbi:GNAT family N-acetyltransferase [Streptococcus castoreus]|uniref:GNAT family N-acetyltransferase n=1 Tax=Streptococcus castoreus TaxID=254786 RepID=UPI00042443E8|nr:GNAT family N-acetyltransferase [Streptococcus castoreus]